MIFDSLYFENNSFEIRKTNKIVKDPNKEDARRIEKTLKPNIQINGTEKYEYPAGENKNDLR